MRGDTRLVPILMLSVLLASAQCARASGLGLSPSTLAGQTLDVGTAYTFSASISGGTDNYSGSWNWTFSNSNVSPGRSSLLQLPGSSLSLTVNAVSGTDLDYTFNGITSSITPGSGTIYGVFTFNGYAQDNTTANTVTTDGTPLLTVNPALDVPQAPAANGTTFTTANVITFTGFASGGTGPYGYNFTITNTGTGEVSFAKVGKSGTITHSANVVVVAHTSNSISIDAGGLGVGSFTANVVEDDSAAVPETEASTSTASFSVSYSPPASVSLTESAGILDAGQTQTLTAHVGAGGIGPFDVLLYNVTGSKQMGGNDVIWSSPGSNTFSIATGATGNFVFNATVSDTGSPSYYTFNSAQVQFTVNNAFSLADLSGSENSVNSGQSVYFTVNLLGGTGPYTVNLVYANGTVIDTNKTSAPGQITFQAFTPPQGSLSIRAKGTDNGPSSPVSYLTAYFVLNVNSISGSSSSSSSTTTTSGGSSGSSTTLLDASSSSTTTMRSSTTTATASTTVKSSPSHVNSSISASMASPARVDFPKGGAYVIVYSSTPGTQSGTVYISNETYNTSLPSYPVGATPIEVLKTNVTSKPGLSVNLTIDYPCATAAASLSVYELVGGVWTKITHYLLNETACTVTFSVPDDPITGVFQQAALSTTSTAAATVLPTFGQGSSGSVDTVIAIVVVIVIILVLYFLASRGKRTPVQEQQPSRPAKAARKSRSPSP